MANRLADETSPYLRQHAENPVDWFPWGPEAFELARAEDRPVLLSVGYSACHWCHVMAHESFEDPATADLMNQWFVNVKVDREERPDIDAVYMEATQAMTGRGGWPMTVFMTAEGEPFFCGTYFPSDPRRGEPTFTTLLEAIHNAWNDRRPELMEQAARLVTSVRRSPVTGQDAALPGAEVLDEATMSMLAAHDSSWGGFGDAPRFPQSMSLDHLLRHHRRTHSPAALTAATTSLDAMAAGGIYDHLGGGFSRYSVDAHWLVPHFEKMLYDNALLVRTYLHAWQVTGEARFAQVCAETIEYVLRDLSHPDGGRYSAEDADSMPIDGDHPEEGAFYVWRPDQVASALDLAGLSEHTEEVLEWYGITEAGNFEGASIPNRMHARGQLDRPEQIERARQVLLRTRSGRARPGLDDKVLTEWNALWVTALAEAGSAMGDARWLTEAERTATFLIERLQVLDPGGPRDGRWLRSWQADLNDGAGGSQHLGYASDYTALMEAFLALHEATGSAHWLEQAMRTADGLIDHFWDPEGGVWSTGDDAEQLVARPKDLMDGATPSANSMAAVALLRLGAFTGEARYDEHARSILRLLGSLVGRHGLAFGHLLHAVAMHVDGITEIVVTGDRPDLVEVVHRRFTPEVVLAWGERGVGPLWQGRDEQGADGRAYVCTDHVCAAPVHTAEELERQLG